MRNFTIAAAAGVAVATLLAACGGTTGSNSSQSPQGSAQPTAVGSSASATSSGGTSSGGSGTVPTACNVLSQSLAAQLTGDTKVTQLASTTTATESVCSYADTSAASSGGVASAYALFERVPAGVSQAALQAALSQASKSGTAQAVSGIGDIAYKEVTSNTAAVVFGKGTVIGVLGVTSPTNTGASLEPQVETTLRTVAAQI